MKRQGRGDFLSFPIISLLFYGPGTHRSTVLEGNSDFFEIQVQEYQPGGQQNE